MSEGGEDPFAQLVTLLQGGTDPEENCRKLHGLAFGMVYNFFRHKSFPPEEAQDLTQDTFIRVFHSVQALQEPRGFKKWLFKIACNVYRNHLRYGGARKRKGHEISLDALLEQAEGVRPTPRALSVPPDPGGEEDYEAWKQRLYAEMDRLPPQMRQCLKLRVGQDLKYREIAQTMGISIQTVKAHLHQAQQRLRARLEE